MIEIFSAATPNGQKIKIILAETDIPHTYHRVSLAAREQKAADFVARFPNGRIPAMIDHDPAGGGAPISIFESGAMLLYMARKYDVLLPTDFRQQTDCVTWLFWQMSGLGPMAGQNGWFRRWAPQEDRFSIQRYTNETARLYGVLDQRLSGRDFVADTYSIADIAIYPWIVPHAGHAMTLTDFPNLVAWFARMSGRPAVIAAYEGVADDYATPRHGIDIRPT